MEPAVGKPTCAACGATLEADGLRFCTSCGKPTGPSIPAPVAPVIVPPVAPLPMPPPMVMPAPPVAAAYPAVLGRRHHPVFALIVAFLLPGAGQAYNGQPFKAAFFLLTSALVLPWIWSLLDAWFVAKKVVRTGGRWGRGGFIWVILQGWILVALGLLALNILTLTGVLR